jgi:hypothetical protein
MPYRPRTKSWSEKPKPKILAYKVGGEWRVNIATYEAWKLGQADIAA